MFGCRVGTYTVESRVDEAQGGLILRRAHRVGQADHARKDWRRGRRAIQSTYLSLDNNLVVDAY